MTSFRPYLPQNDPKPEDRKKKLKNAKRRYRYNYEYVSPLAMVARVPRKDKNSLVGKWARRVARTAIESRRIRVKPENDPAFEATQNELLQGLRKNSLTNTQILRKTQEAVSLAITGRPRSLEDYGEMLSEVGLPPIHKDYTDDSVFASMRTAGPNPLVIERVKTFDDRFPMTEELFRTVCPEDSLAAARQEGRLYLADYESLTTLKGGYHEEVKKYIYAPFSLYVVDSKTRALMPVAIQCDRTPGKDNPILTPKDGVNWLIAKTIVQVADGNHHELVSHLGRTHLFVEPFVIATRRRLAPNHPLHILLSPHFWGTLFINNLAQGHLIAPGGPVDKVMAGTIESTLELVVQEAEAYLFDQAFLPKTFEKRGVDDATVFPNYPFRDDSLLYWKAIHRWVSDYLSIYYHSDADLAQDPELAAWFQELASRDGGRVRGLVTSQTFGTLSYLVDAITLVIFTASVQHAAVNFPQWDLMSYIPNVPGASYSPRPTQRTGATSQDYLDMLPPLEQSVLQARFLYQLGTVHYTEIGKYKKGYFGDSRVQPKLDRFQKEIQNIEDTIKLRNRERRPYEFLLPQGIPQSINI